MAGGRHRTHRLEGRHTVVAALVAVAGVLALVLLSSLSTPLWTNPGQPVNVKGNQQQNNDACVVPSNGKGNCLSTFGVEVGRIGPIYPTQTLQLPVRWSNPNSFDIVVNSFTATVTSSVAGCAAGNLVVPVGTQRPNQTVPRKGTASNTLSVSLPATADDACQTAAFSIRIDATAVKR